MVLKVVDELRIFNECEWLVCDKLMGAGGAAEAGCDAFDRLLSAHTTCRLQHRSLHAYLIDLLTTASRGDPAPLLA